ncbi:hypothetical protein Rhopal_002789-T1 [Rhodotorula paludigena]|uniref:CENP-T/Histone H4 histone fold domain-containing protein n=1 Tax=Rhodotorula paludigena TaxID=86838 RepID=A0AAV5GIW5_9BASI|nr:hypothetical protein Rhopal_002789-T1 [Rhodotorula paludigena]
MDSLGLGLPGGRTPGSGRKISHSEYVRAIAAADTPLRESRLANLAPATTDDTVLTKSTAKTMDAESGEATALQTPAKRRRSMRDRTPKQVQAVLSERKRRMSASAVRKEYTPGGLLRVLSRMPDLPPPTPDDVGETSSASSLRRDSYIPRRSSLAPVAEDASSPFGRSLGPGDATQVADASFSSHDTSMSSATEVADSLLPSRRLSRSFSEGRASIPRLSPAASEHSRSRRSSVLSVVSVASVERGRRAAPLAEDLSRFLVRRGPGRDADKLDDAGGEVDAKDPSRHDFGAVRRFSMGSEMGRETSFAPSEVDSPAAASTSGTRLSIASGFADFSAARLSLPLSLADEGNLARDAEEVQEQGDAMSYPHFGPDEHEFELPDFGGGFEDEQDGEIGADQEEEAERIPWAAKGKGRAIEEEAGENAYSDVADDGAYDWVGQHFAAGPGSTLPEGLPTPPPLALVAENRKKRLAPTGSRAGNKKQRFTRNGDPVVDLPRSKQKALFQQFLGPNVKLDEAAVEALMDASQDFFATLTQSASHAASRAGRSSVINESDVVNAMHAQRLLSTKVPLSSLARQLGVDRELQSIVDGITLHPGKRRAASKRKQRVAQDENAADSE